MRPVRAAGALETNSREESKKHWTPRQFEIPLSFPGKGRYTAEIYADAADADRFPKHVAIEKKTVDSGKRLKMQLAPAGGFAMRLRPAR